MSISLSTSINPNPGFHPTLTTVISNFSSPQYLECSLYLHFTLPPLVFVDPYELETSYADKYSFHLSGHRSLELPVMAMDRAESYLLVNVSLPSTTLQGAELEIPTPVHLRYGDLSSTDEYVGVEIAWPQGFVACSSQLKSQLHPEFAALFQPDDSFIFIEFAPRLEGTNHLASPKTSVEKLRVPVGNTPHTTQVELGTACTVFMCFLYLCWIIWRTKSRLDAKTNVGGTETAQKAKYD
ncbi:protein pbn1 [Moniliophthora roreri MCA 2997]|uniref:Protein PBN1 n=1 Tax=Moniliophthora roreri (strain MCA 2997) TaxID=1381753 RepID=V2YTE0_MONRO|nr:protein pbn1 [Moniliophthora roreri MCA 2997]